MEFGGVCEHIYLGFVGRERVGRFARDNLLSELIEVHFKVKMLRYKSEMLRWELG
jgi:hypothetical protein